jgi:HEAT repeat protein
MVVKLAGLMAALALLVPAARAESCSTLQACLAKFPSVATDGPGVGPEERELAMAVQALGARAVPELIKLLESDRSNVRTLAGYTLRKVDGLKPEHLPALVKARKNGDGWIPLAIARIGTPEAVAFLIEDLRNDPQTATQVTVALQVLGGKAAPGVAKLLRCADPCDEKVLEAAVYVLSDTEGPAAVAVPILLDIANDAKLSRASRRSALAAIRGIGKASAPYASQLISLKARAPEFTAEIDAALAGVGATAAVPSLLQLLERDSEQALRQIAGLGRNGRDTGPTVIKYLADSRWDTRVEAAIALGQIGYAPAEGPLRNALTNEDDWRLVYAATLALAQLKAIRSVDALRRVRDSHWYAPVSAQAASALRHIESGTPITEYERWRFAPIPGSPRTCSRVAEKLVVESENQKLRSPEHLYKRLELAKESVEQTFGVLARNDEKQRRIPEIFFKVADGWLAGTGRGTEEGELVHMPAKGPRAVIIASSIQDIFVLNGQLVAVSGERDLEQNRGILLKIDRDGRGKYRATPWKRLPAVAEEARLLEDERILINTEDSGSVIVDASGRIQVARCQ